MCIKFCLKLSKIAIGACDKLQLTFRGEMNRTQTFICSSEFTSWCNCASGVCCTNVLWCLSKIKYNSDVFMLKWKYLLHCLWSNVWLNAVWLLFCTFCTPQIQSAMILFFFQNSSCTLLGEQKITEQLESLHYQVVKKLLPQW
jgi:hypothetical protein